MTRDLNPLTEPCKFCDAPIPVAMVENELVPVNSYGEPYCNAECLAAHEENQNERRYEAFCENFYGSSSPVTLDEQHRAAWEEKRRLS